METTTTATRQLALRRGPGLKYHFTTYIYLMLKFYFSILYFVGVSCFRKFFISGTTVSTAGTGYGIVGQKQYRQQQRQQHELVWLLCCTLVAKYYVNLNSWTWSDSGRQQIQLKTDTTTIPDTLIYIHTYVHIVKLKRPKVWPKPSSNDSTKRPTNQAM